MAEKMTVQKTERIVTERIRDYWLLMKPELTLLSVFTSVASAFLAIQVPDESQILILLLLAIGTLLVGGGSGALNQYIERDEDALMKRTEKRPVPDRRLTPGESVLFGTGIIFLGILILSTINWLTAFLAGITSMTYVFLYTPLKRISTVSTIIGAIPGALPTLIGWAAISNSLSIESLTLFAILFFWQMPHFYSIGWLYRKDYRNAGYKLLTSVDTTGVKVGRYVFLNQVILLFVGISPAMVGLVTWEYIPVALCVGTAFLYFGWKFKDAVKDESSGVIARRLFFASLFYLPLIFSAMIIFKAGS